MGRSLFRPPWLSRPIKQPWPGQGRTAAKGTKPGMHRWGYKQADRWARSELISRGISRTRFIKPDQKALEHKALYCQRYGDSFLFKYATRTQPASQVCFFVQIFQRWKSQRIPTQWDPQRMPCQRRMGVPFLQQSRATKPPYSCTLLADDPSTTFKVFTLPNTLYHTSLTSWFFDLNSVQDYQLRRQVIRAFTFCARWFACVNWSFCGDQKQKTLHQTSLSSLIYTGENTSISLVIIARWQKKWLKQFVRHITQVL
jgi:hypothetical protein